MRIQLFLSLLFSFGLLNALAQNSDVWNIRAIQENGNSLPVRAYTDDGKRYPVHAYVMKNNSMLDIRMTIKNKQYPVKVRTNPDSLKPVVGILSDGTSLTLRAKGEKRQFRVSALWEGGKIFHIKAMSDNGRYLGVKAISNKGKLYDVKGIKMTEREEEGRVSGTPIMAHVKALPQMGFVGAFPKWSVRAIGPSGDFVPVIALDSKGGKHQVVALKEANNDHILNIKADVKGEMMPVKVTISEGTSIPVAAILPDGELAPLMAAANDTLMWPITAYSQMGNVIHIKAVGENEKAYGVKAISPNGILFDIKGLIFLGQKFEGNENGVNYKAHVKAIPQAH